MSNSTPAATIARYVVIGTDVRDRETGRHAKFQNAGVAQIGAAWLNGPDATPEDYEWSVPVFPHTPVKLPELDPRLVIDMRPELIAQLIDSEPDDPHPDFTELPEVAPEVFVAQDHRDIFKHRWIVHTPPFDGMDYEDAEELAGAIHKAAILNSTAAFLIRENIRADKMPKPSPLALQIDDTGRQRIFVNERHDRARVSEFAGSTFYPLGTFRHLGSVVRNGRSFTLVEQVAQEVSL